MFINQDGNMFCCSRPRRFGKTLAVSTLEAIFLGKQDLLKGLYIDSTDYDWKTYPGIHVDSTGFKKHLKHVRHRTANP